MITEAKKRQKVAMAKAHAEADRLVAGFFTEQESIRGCSVGCDAFDIREIKGENWDLDAEPNGNIHAYVADYFGTPEWLEHLRDVIFEELPEQARSEWHVNIAEALPVGVDFKPIKHSIFRDILLEVVLPLVADGNEDSHRACRDAVQSVATLHDRAITENIELAEWDAASAAASAASAASRSASAAARAARAAWDARAAASAARDAAWAAAMAAAWAAWAAAWADAFEKIAEITLKHLREAA